MKSYTIAEFMAGKHRETWLDRVKRDMTETKVNEIIRKGLRYTIPYAAAQTALMGHTVFAAAKDASTIELIKSAFDPLIHLLITLSYPIAGVMIAGGCLFIMIGSKDKGIDMLRNASIGYILVQLSPLLLKILVGIGAGV